MARLRIKLELNPGGDGIRLDKLANISGELEKFLRSLGDDCGVSSAPGEWVARDFYDGSMGAVVEHIGSVEPAAVRKFNTSFKQLSSFRQDRAQLNGQFSEATYRAFVDIGTRLDTDEIVKIALFDEEATPDQGSDPTPIWEQISKRTTIEVQEAVLSPVYYIGSIQGRLGTWFKESDFIYVRDSVFNILVRCNYKPEMYDMIYRYYKDKKAVVHVSGTVKSDRLSGMPKEISVEKIDKFDRLTDDEFSTFFGIAPDFIGDETASDFIDRMRDDADE